MPFLIQYLGENEKIVRAPHGNVKNKENASNFLPTKTSTIELAKEQMQTTMLKRLYSMRNLSSLVSLHL